MDDIGDDDLNLHREISAKERVDAILEDPNLTSGQAVAALDAQDRENQATFPHCLITTVMVSKSINERDTKVPYKRYVGPFRDRRAAEAWAKSKLSGNSSLTWEAARMDTPEMYERRVAEIRSILEGGEPPGTHDH
jgi:hypothetical protein